MADFGFGPALAKTDRLVAEFDGTAGYARLDRVALQLKPDIAQAVRGDLGDLSMSGWRRGKPIEVTGRYDRLSDHEVAMSPGKRARGPMRVLQQGRNPGLSAAAPRISKKTGRELKRRRWNGTTAGKGTWTDATKIMQDHAGPYMAAEVHKSLVKTFGMGG